MARHLAALGLVAAMLLPAACSATAGSSVAPAPFGTDADRLPAARVRIDGGAVRVELDVRVAEDPEDRARGLQGVAVLPEGAGMLFLFPTDRTGGFWMRGTLVPLDIAFLDGRGRVLAVASMTPCAEDPCPLTDPGLPYRAALEAGAGVLDGVVPGDRVVWEPTAGR